MTYLQSVLDVAVLLGAAFGAFAAGAVGVGALYLAVLIGLGFAFGAVRDVKDVAAALLFAGLGVGLLAFSQWLAVWPLDRLGGVS